MDRPDVIAAVPTPFDAAGRVDEGAAVAVFERVAPAVDAVFVAGTNGEFPALTPADRLTLARAALSVLPAERVILHVGATTTFGALDVLAAVADLGLVRYAAITPMIFPAAPALVVEHFRRLRERIGGQAQLYAYLYPEVASNTVPPERLGDLLPAVDGVKTSGSAAADLPRYRAAVPGLTVWSGDDGALPQVWAAGGRGVVSGCASVFPAPFAALARALGTGDGVATAQARVAAVVALAGRSIAHLKLAATLSGIEVGPPRLTIARVPAADRTALQQLVDAELTAAPH